MASTDPTEVEALLWTGWSGKYALDVGARNGESVEDLKRCGFKRITCFEPSPEAYPKLAENTRLEAGVLIRQLAVSDHDGFVDLYVTTAMSKGELVSPVDGMEWSSANWGDTPHIAVPCTTLNTWCARYGLPDLVKVDVEGHEDRVLDGASDLVEHGCGWIIEFHHPKIREHIMGILRVAGYEIETIRHPHYAPGSPMWRQHGWVRAEKREQ